ncbi:hypothetical protein FRC04_001783 [Tulasnella sp. 424]|nr:hypothetical protein FRC04_001783 [Tulasnella sp. 424]KAG8968176.1 hypothetical protein FRC05_001653 [Tulasnella sp. 425]
MVPQLPTELKINIVKHLDRKTLPSVLRVSSAFHTIGEPLLYHTIFLQPFGEPETRATEDATNCLRTLATKESARSAVRRFGLHIEPDPFPTVFVIPATHIINEFLRALTATLSMLSHVLELDISGEEWIPNWHQSWHQTRRDPPLQSLQHYSGPPSVLENIQSPHLGTLRIYSDESGCEPVCRALSRISKLCGTRLKVLRLVRAVRDMDHQGWRSLIAEIPALFPNLVTLDLTLEFVLMEGRGLSEISRSTSKMKALRLLRVPWPWWMHVDHDQERSVVEELRAECPQLRAICLKPNKAWYFSERRQEWLLEQKNDADGQGCITLQDPEAHYNQYLVNPLREGFDPPSMY